MQNFTDRATIDSPRLTADGYLVASVRCARTGVQIYNGADIGLTDAGQVGVYRPESAVFAKDSLATYAGKPVTVNHPSEMVTADNWKQHAVGDIGAEISRDGETVVVPIKLMDAAAIQAVQNGTREISMGYTTPVEMQDGTAPDGTPYQAVQTGPIRINHLAIVPRARGGSQLRIGDGADEWGASPLIDAETKEAHMPDLQTVVLGDAAAQVAATDAAKVETYKADMAKRLTDAESAHKTAMDAKDAEIAAKDAKIDELQKAALTDADIDKRVADRADLIGKALTVADKLETTGLTDADIRKAAVVKVLGDAAVEGKGQAYIDARFDILVEDAAKADPVQKMKGSPAPKHDTLDAAYQERNATLEGAWKAKGAA